MNPHAIIYYGDGTELTLNTIDVADVPHRDVQVILQREGRHIFTVSGFDYYVWRSPYWRGTNDLADYLMSDGMKKVLFGRWIERDTYEELLNKALTDRDKLRA
jgi:hypothetical protein